MVLVVVVVVVRAPRVRMAVTVTVTALVRVRGRCGRSVGTVVVSAMSVHETGPLRLWSSAPGTSTSLGMQVWRVLARRRGGSAACLGGWA